MQIMAARLAEALLVEGGMKGPLVEGSSMYQEGARLQMERDLAQPREIKMRVEKKNIHIT